MHADAPASRIQRAVVPVVTVAALLAVVLLFREVEYDAEADAYHEQAEWLLRGELHVDRFHPSGYSLLVAAVLSVVGNSLVAGGIVSAIAAGFLVSGAGRLAEAVRPGAWLWGQLLVAANANLWTFGSMACADVTGAALATWAAVFVAEGSVPLRGRSALAVGLLCGFAVATRFAALTPGAAIVLWCLWRARRWSVAGLLLVGLVVGYAPEGVPRMLRDGSPLPADNWQNLYFKVVCDYDLEALHRAEADGAMPSSREFFAAHGVDVVVEAVQDVGPSASSVLPALLVGRDPPPPPWPLRLWPTLLAFAGLLVRPHGRANGRWLALLALVHIGTVCLFWPRVRLFFAVLPILVAGLAALLAAVPRASIRRWVGVLAVAGCLALGVDRFREYLAAQPVAEARLAARLPGMIRRPIAVLSPWAMLRRHVDGKVWGYVAPLAADPAQGWRLVRERMAAVGAELFLVGRASGQDLHAQLRSAAPPEGMRVLVDDGEVLLAERDVATSDWIEACVATPSRAALGTRVEWRIELARDADLAKVYGAGIVLTAPGGAQHMVSTTRDGLAFVGDVVPDAEGVWTGTPWILLVGDRIERGAPVSVTIAPR